MGWLPVKPYKNIYIFAYSRRVLFAFILLTIQLIAVNSIHAADTNNVSIKKSTSLGLYFTARQAYNHLQSNSENTLFIDVRDPVEVNYTGMPSAVDANIPFMFTDISKWDMKKKQFKMKLNKSFVDDVTNRLNAKGLTKLDTVIVICRSGVRSAKAANKLSAAGFAEVYNLVEGFEGDAVKKGQKKGQRILNGWKNAGLPWNTPKHLDRNKMYGNPAPFNPEEATLN